MNLDDYTDVLRTKVLVYGPPKSGKTAQVAKLAIAGYTVHLFDLENGAKTLLNPAILPPEFRKNVKIYNIPDHKDYPIADATLRALFKGGAKKYCFVHGMDRCGICSKVAGNKWSEEIDLAKFTDKDVLVIDSWTQVANSVINKIIAPAVKKDEEYKPSWDDWRLQGARLDEILSKIQVSNINIVVLSHEIDVEKSETKEKIVPVGGTRNFSKTMAKYFDEVAYCSVLNKRHGIYSATTYSNTVLTGGRSGIQLESGQDASLVDFFKPRAELQKPATPTPVKKV